MKYRLSFFASAILWAVSATALSQSEGITAPLPVITFVVLLILSATGLAYAVRGIANRGAYVAWVGIAATLAAAYGTTVAGDPSLAARAGLLAVVFGCIVAVRGLVGLKVHEKP